METEVVSLASYGSPTATDPSPGHVYEGSGSLDGPGETNCPQDTWNWRKNSPVGGLLTLCADIVWSLEMLSCCSSLSLGIWFLFFFFLGCNSFSGNMFLFIR